MVVDEITLYLTAFICCWLYFANILLRIFVPTLTRDVGLQFYFLVISLSGFWIRVKLTS